MRSFFLPFAFAAVVACSASAEPPDAARSDLVGGVAVDGHAMDAVGALVVSNDAGSRQLCNGTLIAPRIVLTAKHCAEQRKKTNPDGTTEVVQPPVNLVNTFPFFFMTGSDLNHPTHKVAVESSVSCASPDEGGMDGYGCNLALFYLSEAITDIAPLRTHLATQNVGQPLTLVSFGDGAAGALSTRRGGTVTLASVAGAPIAAQFPSAQAYIDRWQEADGPLAESKIASLTESYSAELLAEHEAWFAPGEVQPCNGDSGAPILENGVVYGLAIAPSSKSGVCPRVGALFAVLGGSEQAFLSENKDDPCGSESVTGRCDGEVAVRCTRSDEGPRRVTRSDCGALLQRCVPASDSSRVACGE